MKVLLLNSSPRLKKSSTFRLLKALEKGMKAEAEAGELKTEIVNLAAYEIKNCSGCYSCWLKTVGECACQDDMIGLLEAFAEADLIVFGTPLYHFSMNSIMKKFIDRTLPLYEPWLVESSGQKNRTVHPKRKEKAQSMFLVSACGFPEIDNFSSLKATFRHYGSLNFDNYLGETFCSSAEILSQKKGADLAQSYLNLVQKAGRELIRNKKISAGLKSRLDKGLFEVEKDKFYELAAGYWEQRMEAENGI